MLDSEEGVRKALGIRIGFCLAGALRQFSATSITFLISWTTFTGRSPLCEHAWESHVGSAKPLKKKERFRRWIEA